MASEDDVLERAGRFVERIKAVGQYPGDGRDARWIMEALAAEVRELRKDRERLVNLFRAFAQKINVDGHNACANAVEAICDAVMGEAKGE